MTQFCYVKISSTKQNERLNLVLMDDPGRVRSQITSVVCKIQRFDFDCNLVLTGKVIIPSGAALHIIIVWWLYWSRTRISSFSHLKNLYNMLCYRGNTQATNRAVLIHEHTSRYSWSTTGHKLQFQGNCSLTNIRGVTVSGKHKLHMSSLGIFTVTLSKFYDTFSMKVLVKAPVVPHKYSYSARADCACGFVG